MEAQDKTPRPVFDLPPETLPGNGGASPSVLLASPKTVAGERRAHRRYAVDEDSVLLVVNHGLSIACRLLELSLEGCRLRTQERFTLTPGVRIEVAFKVNQVGFRFLGVIQWSDENCLVGIRFNQSASRRGEQLAEVVSEIQAAADALAARQQALNTSAESEASRLACEQAATEERHWTAIQKEARKARATREARALLSSLNRPTRERRAHVRQAVETTATIVLVKTGSRLKGRIVDLSLGGCRIRADQRLPVGVYTRVETEFQFQGLPFLLGGVIQNLHDPQTVGIRFLDVSYRKREQLQQLIDELAAAQDSPYAAGPDSPDSLA